MKLSIPLIIAAVVLAAAGYLYAQWLLSVTTL